MAAVRTLLFLFVGLGLSSACPCSDELVTYQSCLNGVVDSPFLAAKREMAQLMNEMNQLQNKAYHKSSYGGSSLKCLSGIAQSRYFRTRNMHDVIVVKFPKAFTAVPAVSYGEVHLDTSNAYNIRLKTKLLSVTRYGFKIYAKTWGGSHTWKVNFSWMACPKKQ